MRPTWAGAAFAAVIVIAACGGGGSPLETGTAGRTGSPSRPAATTTTTTLHTATPSAPTRRTSPPRTPLTPRTTAAPGPTDLPAALRDGVVTRIPTSARQVALTFDGGAGSQGAAAILATLRDQAVPASFFVTGQFATANPSITRQMAALGPVGNHTWSHPDLTKLSAGAIHQELSSARSAIMAATGRDPRPLFRFPYGAYDSRVLGVVHAEGYGGVGWTTDSLGWKGTSGGMNVDKVVARVLAGRTPGQIVLMHVGANPDDGTTLDAAALPRIIAGLRSHGYRFTTLSALLG